MPQNVSASSPLGALVARQKLLAKIERGEQAIRNGEGISQKPDESNEDFFNRLNAKLKSK